MERIFATSRDAKLKWSTAILLSVLAVVALLMALAATGNGDAGGEWAIMGVLAFYLLIVGIVVGSSVAYSPKRYRLADDHLSIERGFAPKRISRDAIVSVERLDATDMRGTWRTAGIGGVFCWHGWFRNKKLGDFYMSATRSDRLVLIRTANERLVLTPDLPDEFVRSLSETLD